jgi:hypothetical protein
MRSSADATERRRDWKEPTVALEGTWTKAIERTHGYTMPSVSGPGEAGKGRVTGETVAPGRWRVRGGQRVMAGQSSRAQYPNPRPATGRTDLPGSEEYTEAVSTVWTLTARFRVDSARGQLRCKCAEYLTEKAKLERHGDGGAAVRMRALAEEIGIRADFFAGVTTGNVGDAKALAQAARAVIA